MSSKNPIMRYTLAVLAALVMTACEDKPAPAHGEQTFQGNFIGDTGAGWSDWKGEWKLL